MPKKITFEVFLNRVGESKLFYCRESYEAPGPHCCAECPEHGVIRVATKAQMKSGTCRICSYTKGGSTRRQRSIAKLKAKVAKGLWPKLSFDFSTFTKMCDNTLKGVCSEHGEFTTSPTRVLNSLKYVCGSCSDSALGEAKRVTPEEIKSKINNKYKGRVAVVRSEVRGGATWVTLTCANHPNITTVVRAGALSTSKHGCKECAKEQAGVSKRVGREAMLKRLVKKFGTNRLTFDLSMWNHNRDKLEVYCRIHKTTTRVTSKDLTGSSVTYVCPECTPKKKVTWEEFVSRGREVLGNTIDLFTESSYGGLGAKVSGVCPDHGGFTVDAASVLNFGVWCKLCNKGSSYPQLNLGNSVFDLGIRVVMDDRKVIKPLEIDILMPDLKLGIEYNGIYWHSSAKVTGKCEVPGHKRKLNKLKWHMRAKQLLAAEQGTALVHFDSTTPHHKMVNYIKARAGLMPTLFARKGKLVKVENTEAEELLNREHLQGFAKGCQHVGLEFDGKLKAVMSFSRANSERGNKDRGRWELRRFVCDECRIAGGASRLLKFFTRNNPSVTSMVSYSDNRWFDGGVYEALGFTLVKESSPDYCYIKQCETFHKAQFRHSTMAKRKDFIYNSNLPEKRNTENNGFFRLYDCGKKKWELNLAP